MPKRLCTVTAGIDTHKDTHTVAALDQTGQWLETRTFPTTQVENVARRRAALGLSHACGLSSLDDGNDASSSLQG